MQFVWKNQTHNVALVGDIMKIDGLKYHMPNAETVPQFLGFVIRLCDIDPRLKKVAS